jgi:DNA-directed RNA polymerase subunit RPC12/RpoP
MSNSRRPALAFTKDLSRSTSKRPIFGTANFALPDFDIINRCSYFDYQRDRVSARFPGRRKKNTSLTRKPIRRKLKINKAQIFSLLNCPECRSRKIVPTRRLARQVIDLKFSSSGVKKWVVRYETSEYRCEKCRSIFAPKDFPSSDSKFGWNLMVWCIYSHFSSGQNLSRVTVGLSELFQLDIPQPTVYRFKSYVASRYRSFCRQAFEALMRSPYLYIDETPVNLRTSPTFSSSVAALA